MDTKTDGLEDVLRFLKCVNFGVFGRPNRYFVVVWIPDVPLIEKDCYLPLESQTTGPQTTNLPLVDLAVEVSGL